MGKISISNPSKRVDRVCRSYEVGVFEEGDDTKIMRVLAVYSFANIICAGVGKN